jgi:hypothetical protein
VSRGSGRRHEMTFAEAILADGSRRQFLDCLQVGESTRSGSSPYHSAASCQHGCSFAGMSPANARCARSESTPSRRALCKYAGASAQSATSGSAPRGSRSYAISLPETQAIPASAQPSISLFVVHRLAPLQTKVCRDARLPTIVVTPESSAARAMNVAHELQARIGISIRAHEAGDL